MPQVTGLRGLGRGAIVLLVVALVVVIGGAAGAGLWHVSASPKFCNSCHIMRPYVDAWRHSRHAAVPCVECHYPPGLRDTLRVKFQAVKQVAKWATGTYNSKPFAEVEDASCLRSGCHAASALAAKGVLTFAGRIRFDHRTHLQAVTTGWQLRCTSCHAQVVEGQGGAPRERCLTCHNQPEKLERFGDLAGIHAVHVTEKTISCTRCHDEVKHRLPPPIGAPSARAPASIFAALPFPRAAPGR